tara:strand:+ start:4321 stop:4560 length:240 start_codon:yes stop_codon:yes gene_type:complete
MNKNNNNMSDLTNYPTLYQRLKPEFKRMLKDYGSKYPHSYNDIIKSFEANEFFIEVKYGTADSACRACEMSYFGDLFDE